MAHSTAKAFAAALALSSALLGPLVLARALEAGEGAGAPLEKTIPEIRALGKALEAHDYAAADAAGRRLADLLGVRFEDYLERGRWVFTDRLTGDAHRLVHDYLGPLSMSAQNEWGLECGRTLEDHRYRDAQEPCRRAFEVQWRTRGRRDEKTRDAEARYARYLAAVGRLDEAVEHYAAAAEYDLDLAIVAYRRGAYATATDRLAGIVEEALRAQKDRALYDVRAEIFLACLLIDTHRIEEGRLHLANVFAFYNRDSTTAESWIGEEISEAAACAARASRMEGDLTSAAEAFRSQIAAFRPAGTGPARLELGLTLLALKRPAEAEEVLREAVGQAGGRRLHPRSLLAVAALAEALAAQGRIQEADTLYTEAIQGFAGPDPGHPRHRPSQPEQVEVLWRAGLLRARRLGDPARGYADLRRAAAGVREAYRDPAAFRDELAARGFLERRRSVFLDQISGAWAYAHSGKPGSGGAKARASSSASSSGLEGGAAAAPGQAAPGSGLRASPRQGR